MSAAQGIEQAAHLVTVPHISALKFGQSDNAAVDIVDDGRDLHCSGPFVMVGSGARSFENLVGFHAVLSRYPIGVSAAVSSLAAFAA